MRRISVLALVASVTMLSVSLSAQPAASTDAIRSVPAPVLHDTTGMFIARFAQVGEDTYIAGQPTERALRELKARGVTTVINLRAPDEMRGVPFDEEKLVRELGMTYVYLPVRGNAQYPYTPATLAEFTRALKEAPGKVLLHCTVAWRASHLWGAFLIQQGLPPADALAHTRAINLMDDHRMTADGRQPIEQFLGRQVPGLGRGH